MRVLAIIAQNLFWGMVTGTVAGTVCVMAIMILNYFPQYRNHRLKMAWIKTAELMYLFPVAVLMVIISRADFSVYGIAWFSDFWRTSTASMQKGYLIIESAVLGGLISGLIFRGFQYRKLHEVLTGNIPVENETCNRMIERYREIYNLKNIEFYQNDLLENPICAGIRHPKIILPIKEYTEKELHMILEHEISHIRRRDLFWKKIGLLVTFVHWWNPFSYFLLKELIFQVEVECDITSCENTGYFTKREYALYLTGLEDSKDDMIFASALCKTKKDTIRRIEGMAKAKKGTKRLAAISCVGLLLFSVIPSYAAAEGMARVNEQWIAEGIVTKQEELVDYAALENTTTLAEEGDVQEIDISAEDETGLFNTNVVLDRTIAKNTRLLYQWMQMKQGDAIMITTNCSDSSIVYRIGIRDSGGNMTYVQGSGSMTHVFNISSDGSYTAFVQNTSTTTSMQVTGRATYINY